MTVTTSPATGAKNQTLLAAGFILIYALVVTYADNFIRTIAEEAGLWQFHATRTVFAAAILLVLTPVFGLKLWPRHRGAVVRRSLIHGCAMMLYFGSLGFLSVSETLAGLFTAPIFVLIFSRLFFGHRIGPFRILAVVVGFVGALMVLGLGSGMALTPALLLPIAAGAFYALGNIATREWCEGESTESLLLGFFLALGLFGLIGLGVLALWRPDVPAGAEGFLLRGFVWPGATFYFWTFVQAAVSVLGVGMMVKSYQIADASRVAVFEYVLLPMGVFWTWFIWGEMAGPVALAGIGLIFAAGLIIAARSG